MHINAKYRLAQKQTKTRPNHQNIVLSDIKNLPMRLYVILSVGIKYSVSDLLCGVNYLTYKVAICVTYVQSALPMGISSP